MLRTLKNYTHILASLFLSVAPLLSTSLQGAEATQEVNPDCLFFQTIHGDLVVDDSLAIELIQSPIMQRLKHIYQYGVNEFALPKKNYHFTRFEHSLGVYQILKDRGASRREQIAGLLHDASHTVFSHTMDPLFMGGMNKGGYQDTIHAKFLKTYGAEKILLQCDFDVEDVLPDRPEFRCLEQPGPQLCTDRVQYILQAGHLEELMTPLDVQQSYDDLQFDGQNWYFRTPEIAEKFAFISLNQTLNTWGSPDNLVLANWVSEIVKILWKRGKITGDDVHFNLTDEQLWSQIINSKEPEIQVLVQKVLTINDQFDLFEDEGEIPNNYRILYAKFRGVDPYVLVGKELVLLTQISPKYKQDYEAVRQHIKEGWKIKLK